MDAIYVDNLTKSFGQVKALSALSFSVKAGTVCGFIGPNGAGKTTTIRILLGLLPKDAGTVRILGEEVNFGRELEARKRLAYLPQDPVFPEKHTGLEILELVGALYGMSPAVARERGMALLKEFHLEKAGKQSVGTYSRGMKQRLGLAACFLPEPELLILDEPVSALDPEGRVEVFDLLKRLKGKATVLFSSHILDDVERVSDALVMIREGKKVVDGSIEDILNRYAVDRLRVKLRPDDKVRGKEVIRKLPWVESLSDDDETGAVLVDVRPGMIEQAVDETIAKLVREGLRVTEYGRAKTDLESLFLRLNRAVDQGLRPTGQAG